VGASDVDPALVGTVLVEAIVGDSVEGMVEGMVEGSTEAVVVVADSPEPQAAIPSRSAAAAAT
jgi:hypothetical protein